MRKLASIRRISDIQPIKDADAIEVASVDGWKVVTKKGEFKPGDLCIYIEIDSWVPTEIASFLSKGKEPREYNGVKGERLRTAKLRGQISQGLVIPVDYAGGEYFIAGDFLLDGVGAYVKVQEGDDVTETLGIQKWEPPISPQLQGQVRGTFPTHIIPKTDQERIQNIFNTLNPNENWEVTVKLDGSSMTVFRLDGELRVCSRNMELKVNEENSENSFVKMATRLGDNIPEGYAVQGELMGPGIQGNREGLKDFAFFVYDVWDIPNQRYLAPTERQVFCIMNGLNHVPILTVRGRTPTSVEKALELAEGESLYHKVREGIVFKSLNDPSLSFKVISNKFLLKGGN